MTPLWDWLGDWVGNRASKQLATQFATIYMCSCQNTSPDSPEISALDKQIIHIHACQTPFMSIYLHIQILYTCIDLCMCAYVYLQSFPTKHLKKPRHFPLLKPPFPTWSVWPDGSKGGGPKSLQTKFDTPSSEDMSDNKITNFNKKKPLSDNLIGWCLVEKLGPMPWS